MFDFFEKYYSKKLESGAFMNVLKLTFVVGISCVVSSFYMGFVDKAVTLLLLMPTLVASVFVGVFLKDSLCCLVYLVCSSLTETLKPQVQDNTSIPGVIYTDFKRAQ